MPLISPNFDVKSIIFSQGPFPKIAGKNPASGDLDEPAHMGSLTEPFNIYKTWN